MERSARKPITAKDEIDNWDKDVPLPKWLDEVELLSIEEAIALSKLGLDVRAWWYVDVHALEDDAGDIPKIDYDPWEFDAGAANPAEWSDDDRLRLCIFLLK